MSILEGLHTLTEWQGRLSTEGKNMSCMKTVYTDMEIVLETLKDNELFYKVNEAEDFPDELYEIEVEGTRSLIHVGEVVRVTLWDKNDILKSIVNIDMSDDDDARECILFALKLGAE